MTREQKLKEIWRNTHRDFKGIIDNKKYVLVLRQGGTHAVQLDQLTDLEIARLIHVKLGIAQVPLEDPALLHNTLKQIVGDE